MTTTKTFYLFQINMAPVAAWCPDCLLPTLVRTTFAVTEDRYGPPAHLINPVVCVECGAHIVS